MRGPTVFFWFLTLFVFLGTAALAAAFFLRYRKEIRHAFLLILSVGLFFLIYALMVYGTSFPEPMPGLPLMIGALILLVYAILAWDTPLSFAYLLNEALSRRGRAFIAIAGAAPAATLAISVAIALAKQRSYDEVGRIMFGAVDLAAAFPAAAMLGAAILALKSARSSSGWARASRIAFAATAFAFLPASLYLRYAVFPRSYPQDVLAFVTILLAWDIIATGIAFFFGPGEKQDGPFVAVPDDFIAEAGITAREAEALELLAAGSSYKAIAATLGISMPAVKKRISSVYRKSGAANRVELVNILLEYGSKKHRSEEE
jgi:Response regulator containing a CheY-like receiver domain and an HTH DNA-binding domain